MFVHSTFSMDNTALFVLITYSNDYCCCNLWQDKTDCLWRRTIPHSTRPAEPIINEITPVDGNLVRHCTSKWAPKPPPACPMHHCQIWWGFGQLGGRRRRQNRSREGEIVMAETRWKRCCYRWCVCGTQRWYSHGNSRKWSRRASARLRRWRKCRVR